MESVPFINLEYLFQLVYCVVTGGCGPDISGTDYRALWNTYTTVSTLVSLVVATGVVYCIIRINQLMKLDKEQLLEYVTKRDKPKGTVENKWDDIEILVASESPNDWRQAIIEADIMLDALLTKAGYIGDSVGDKLKQVEKGEFVKINEAWEAHKVRNHIAHRGSDYILTKREARRVIELYRSVFSDFYFV
jgi:hypothetical protein